MDSILELKLRNACSSGELATVRRLLDDQPSLINTRDVPGKYGQSLVAYASMKHQKAVVGFLIEFIKEHGLDINVFAWLAVNIDIDINEMLIAAGVDVNRPNVDGITSLHAAALDGNYGLVELLLSKGANVNGRDTESGVTPLFHAAVAGKPRMAQILLENGADPNIRATGNRYFWGDIRVTPGMSALRLALISREPGVAEVIRSRGGLE